MNNFDFNYIHPQTWYSERNGTLSPSDVLPGSTRTVWWRCHNQRRLPYDETIFRRAGSHILFASMPYEFMRPLLKNKMLPAEIAEYLVLPVDTVEHGRQRNGILGKRRSILFFGGC
ncbi:zinc-ribbon domain-containing protein [Salibacterium sp. K-3]